MQVTMEMPEPPEGFEYTGEYRPAKKGEHYYWDAKIWVVQEELPHTSCRSRCILRKKRRRASEYRFVGSYGGINTAYDDNTWLDDTRYQLGNYFHTDEEARASKFYKIFHGEEGQ